jgi:hypothetical protein
LQDDRKSPDAGPRAPAEPAERPEAKAWRGHERRAGDRRGRPTRPWQDILSPLRRATGRRAGDRRGYVDRYSKQDVALLLAIFLLNVADAFMTMRWLHRGGHEANPVMEFFLDVGPAAFLAQKCLVVGFWLILLLVHKNFRFAKIGLYASLAVYSLLLIVHFGIVALGIEPPRRDAAYGDEPHSTLEVPRREALPMTRILAIGTAASPLSRTGDRPAGE